MQFMIRQADVSMVCSTGIEPVSYASQAFVMNHYTNYTTTISIFFTVVIFAPSVNTEGISKLTWNVRVSPDCNVISLLAVCSIPASFVMRNVRFFTGTID